MEELIQLRQQLSSLLGEKTSLRQLDDLWDNYLINNDRLIQIDEEIRSVKSKIRLLLHIPIN